MPPGWRACSQQIFALADCIRVTRTLRHLLHHPAFDELHAVVLRERARLDHPVVLSTEKRAIGNGGTPLESALTIRPSYSSAGRAVS
jgi:hypothetical protein